MCASRSSDAMGKWGICCLLAGMLLLGVLSAAPVHGKAWPVFAGNMVDGGHADLVYEPATGNVLIDPRDTETKKTVSFILYNPAGQMIPIDPDKVSFVLYNWFNSPRQIGFTDLSLNGKEGVLDLGPILPPGMNKQQLSEFLATAKYAYALGKGGDLDLVVIPEPGALALMALGLAGLARAVRRKAEELTQRRRGAKNTAHAPQSS